MWWGSAAFLPKDTIVSKECPSEPRPSEMSSNLLASFLSVMPALKSLLILPSAVLVIFAALFMFAISSASLTILAFMNASCTSPILFGFSAPSRSALVVSASSIFIILRPPNPCSRAVSYSKAPVYKVMPFLSAMSMSPSNIPPLKPVRYVKLGSFSDEFTRTILSIPLQDPKILSNFSFSRFRIQYLSYHSKDKTLIKKNVCVVLVRRDLIVRRPPVPGVLDVQLHFVRARTKHIQGV